MTNTNIFVDDDVRPLLVFLDSTHPALSKDRKWLIRILKNGGADLQLSPDNADIILAQEGAEQFANSHRHKVVLDVEWVHASVERGRCFTEREDWGDYRVLPTQEELQDPQFTTGHAATPPLARSASIPAMFNGGVPGQLPAHVLMGNPQPSGSMQAMPFGSQWAPLLQQLGSNAYQPPPASQTPAFHHYPSQAQLLPSVWADNPAILLGGPLMTIPVYLQQAILDQMTNLAPDNPHSRQLNALVLALLAQQRQSAIQSANDTALLHAQSMGSASVSSVLPSRRDSPTRPSTSEHRQRIPSSSRRQERARSPPPSRPSPVKKQSASAPASAPLKRKSRDETSMDRTKQRRVSRAEAETEPARATLKSKKREPTKPASQSQRRLFIDEHGSPVPCYVQSGTKWRNDSVSVIRQHGGEIVAEISEATYVVLWPEVDHSYERLREALIHEKTAVRSAWVRDAGKTGKLMDPSEKPYTLDGCRLRDRSKREVLVNLAKLEREVETERNKVAKSKLRKHLQLGSKQAARRSTGEQAQKRNHEEGSDDVEEREVLDAVNRASENRTDDEPNIPQRSAPPTEAAPRPSRGNKFTEAEMKSCQEFCTDLMNNDPTISTMEIASRLAEKMPRHSAASWNYKLRPLRQDIEDAAHREVATSREADETVVQPHASVDSGPAGAQPASPQVKSRNSPPPPLPPHYQEDRDIAINFFLNTTEENEALVWQKLSAQHTCRSASSWEEFWNTYHADISANLQVE